MWYHHEFSNEHFDDYDKCRDDLLEHFDEMDFIEMANCQDFHTVLKMLNALKEVQHPLYYELLDQAIQQFENEYLFEEEE